MPRSIEEVIAWTRDPRNANRHQGGNWHDRCEQYTNNAADFDQSFDNAWLAAQASGPLNASLAGIKNGAVGYWRGVWIKGEECGHTALWYEGVWWMASDACGEARTGLGQRIGNGTGWITHSEYSRLRPAAIWKGWSMRHGEETLAGASSAVAGSTPLDIIAPKEKKRMSVLIRNYDGSIGLVTEDGELVPLASTNEVESLKATGLVGDYVQMGDGNVWNTLASITGRKIAQRAATDPAAIASHVAPLVVSAVLASLEGVAGLTQEQVEQAAESAIRTVFADAGK
jgi:hypothetical protein